jgi:selenocysteine-specific elongation factor
LSAALASAPEIVDDGDTMRLKTFRVRLKIDEDEASKKIEALFREGGLAVPGQAEVLAKCGVDAARARTILQMLLKSGTLVRISPDLICHREAVEGLMKTLASHKGQTFSVPDFKDWTCISRKYAIPLLEHLDRTHVTARVGDARKVL